MFTLVLLLLSRLLDNSRHDQSISRVMHPILLEFHQSAVVVSQRDGVRPEFPEYKRNGGLKAGVSDDEIHRLSEGFD